MIFWPIKLFIKVVGAIVAVAVIYLSITFIQIWYRGTEHSTAGAQAILVFGTAAYGDRPSPELQDRLQDAYTLWLDGRAAIIAVTGGKRPGDVETEAQVSAQWLESRSDPVPQSDVVVGGGSDTWQNVATVASELKARGWTTVLVVTDPFHEYRAMAVATDQGLTPLPAPVAHSAVRGSALLGYYAKETLEVGLARFVGYHTLSNWLHS